jgi:hypothetical protein
MQTAHSCGLRTPPRPPLGMSQSRRGLRSRSILQSAAGGEEDVQGTGDPMLLRGLVSWQALSWQARRLAASRNIAHGTSGRKGGRRWSLARDMVSQHGQHALPSPLAHSVHAHCRLALRWTAFCTRQMMMPVRLPSPEIPQPSRRRTLSPLTMPPSGMS